MQLTSLWQKCASEWRPILQKVLPCMLAVGFIMATVLTVAGQQAQEQEFATIDAAKAELDARQQSLQLQQQELASAMTQAQTLLGQLNDSNANTQDLLEQAATENGKIDDKIDDLNTAYENVENKERQQWVLPMQYLNCSSYYGYRSHPVKGESNFHRGVDLAGDRGTPIVASRSGTVEIAEYLENDAGYWVLIDHLDGYESAYMHMDKYIVTQGQFVVAGQIIGYCGDSGVATGCHLHFEIRKDNATVNPADYIDM